MKAKRTIYEVRKYGVYNFTCKNVDGSLSSHKSEVEVQGETDKKYIIRLSEPIREHKVGDVIEVLKRNVKLHRDCSNDFWNKD